MSPPAVVLVHGGLHGADCWDLTVAELRRQAPSLPVLAVDLPGRGGTPADLGRVTVRDWVGSVVADIDRAGLDDVIIVGHSMAGITVPAVAAQLGPARAREMVLIAAFVPPQGRSVVEAVAGWLAWYARWGARRGRAATMPWPVARLLLGNGMTAEQRNFLSGRLRPESARVIVEPVHRPDACQGIRRTWVLTRRDRMLSGRAQRRRIAALGGVDAVIALDACHDVMISHPGELARVLIERCVAGGGHHTG